jgi:hypothetical protein
VAVPETKNSDCSYPTTDGEKVVEPRYEIPLLGRIGPWTVGVGTDACLTAAPAGAAGATPATRPIRKGRQASAVTRPPLRRARTRNAERGTRNADDLDRDLCTY